MMAWFYQGGGDALYKELTQEILGLDVYGFYGFPMPAQPFGWFKNPGSTVADVQGFKFRSVGLAADLLSRPDRKSTRLNSSHYCPTRMPSSAGTNTTRITRQTTATQ